MTEIPNEWEEARKKEQDPFMQDGETWDLPIIQNIGRLPDGELSELALDNMYRLSRLGSTRERKPFSPC